MILNSPFISGSLTVTGNTIISGSLTAPAGIAGTASYASNAELLDGLDSTSFAKTGSNAFSGSQTITGSLTATGTIVAQTLVVQTVTSSIVYSSGSNVFGNNSGNNHQFTGSVLMSGSVGIGRAPEFTLDVNGDIALNRTNKLMFSRVGVGDRDRSYITGDGNNNLFIYGPSSNLIATFAYTGYTSLSGLLDFQGSNTIGSANDKFALGVSGSSYAWIQSFGGRALVLQGAGNNVGIGITNPTGQLSIKNQVDGGSNPVSSYTATGGAFGQNFFNGYYVSNSDGLGTYPRYLDIVSVGSPDGTNGGSNIRFFTNPVTNNSPALEHMRITSRGFVGIGNTNPQRKFVVSNGGAEGVEISYGTGFGSIISYNRSSGAWQPLVLQEGTGNVLVGTSSNSGHKLYVAGTVRIDGTITNYTGANGEATIDTSTQFTTLVNGAYVDFPSMSGMILVNNTGTGAVQAFLCGGGNVLSLGYVVNNTGNMAHSPGVGGYRFTNNTGSTWVFSFQVFKTRGTA